MLILWLFDLVPDPVKSSFSVAGLILMSLIVLMLTAAVIVGLVFLTKAMTGRHMAGLWVNIRRLRFIRAMVGDVCLSVDAAVPKAHSVAHKNR